MRPLRSLAVILIFVSTIRFLTPHFHIVFEVVQLLGMVALLGDIYRNRKNPKTDIQTLFADKGPSQLPD